MGSHVITLTATDSGGATGSSIINIVVNAAPVVGSASVSPDPVNIGVSTTFSWSASDPDGDTLTCLLDIDGDGTDDYTVSDCGNNTSQAHTYTAAGSYLARLTVSDGVNASVQQSVNVTVTDPDPGNVSPQISSFDASPDALPTGGSTSFGWAVSDADGDTLTCSLDADGDGTNDYTITDCANNTSQAHTYAQAGTYEAKLTVSDGSNAPVEQSKTVTVATHSIQISSFDATPVRLGAGGSATFSWSVSDTEGDTLTCFLDVDADGTDDYIINDCANNTSQAHSYPQAGNHQVKLTVSDGVIASVQQTVAVEISAPPVIVDFTASPDPIYTTVATTLYWQVSDPEGDTLTCLLAGCGWRW